MVYNLELFYEDCRLLVPFANSLDPDQVTVLCVCVCVSVCMFFCRCVCVYLKTLFIKAYWPILYTSMHNQCLNIDVQVETCMTMSLLEGREDSRHYFTINLNGTGAPPGSPDRQVSAHGHVTNCATRPVGIYRTYTVFMSLSFHFVWS